MKNWIIGFFVIMAAISYGQSTPQELWTYTGVADGTLLSAVPSETGTGSAFGTGAAFLRVSSGAAQIGGTANPASDYAEGLSPAKYAGETTGIYQISYTILSAGFFPPFPPPLPSGQFGWGLRSNVSGSTDCKALFQQLNGNFEMVVHDANGPKAPVLIQTARILTAPVTVRQLYFMDQRGTPGSFQVFFSLGGGSEQELYPGQLTLPSDFQMDEFTMEVTAASGGFNWKPSNVATFDNLALDKVTPQPELTFVGQNVSFIQDNGVMDNTLYPPYEPGDVLQVVTTNKNIGTGPANNVSTSLSAGPAFKITPLSSTTFASVPLGGIFTATYRVEVLSRAVDGNNPFTVINRIAP